MDEVCGRILNADGASWLKRVKDRSIRFQLAPFQRNKALREKIHDRKAVEDAMELLEGEKTEEVFEYLELYKNSLWEEGEIEDTEDLTAYYRSNEEGLLPCRPIRKGFYTGTWGRWKTMCGV